MPPAANDDSYIDYLTKNGLGADECATHSPGALFEIVRVREKLGFGGAPGHEATTVDTFYQKYLEVLKPYNDSHHAEVAKARLELRELFYFITDALEDVTRDRTYITNGRINTLIEHYIVRLAEPGIPSEAWDLDLSVDDAAAYIRTRYVLIGTAAAPTPDFDAFRGKVADMLRRISRKVGAIEPRTLHYYAVIFADNYQTPLNPLIGASD